MFEGWLDNILADALKAFNPESIVKFREQADYKKHFDAFGDALKEYYERKPKTDGLEGLMLASYRMMKFVRRHNNILISHTAGTRPIDTAVMEVVEILDAPLEHCVPLYMEADALETLSFSAFKILKEAGDIVHCKHCKKFYDEPCKKHKAPSSVADMWYCSGCRGFITKICDAHGAAACKKQGEESHVLHW